MEITEIVIQLILVLAICGLIFSNWQPPIKQQYQMLLLGIIGVTLGIVLGCGVVWGFICAGMVFYKNKLMEELKLIKDCLMLTLQTKKDLNK